MIAKYLYDIYGLPTAYCNVSYKDTALIAVKQEEIQGKIANAPSKGLLAIQGNAAPIINQMLEAGKKVRGINFLERSADAFGIFENPAASVVVIYNVGSEISVNTKVSSLVLKNILKNYSNSNTLVIIETHLTKSELLSNYHVQAVNFIKIANKEEESWV